MNSVNLIGRLTSDPKDISGLETPGCSMHVAFDAGPRRRGFVRVAIFGPQAKACLDYLHRGDEVGITGHLDYSEWRDRETGERRERIEVGGVYVEFLRKAPKTGLEAAEQLDSEVAKLEAQQ